MCAEITICYKCKPIKPLKQNYKYSYIIDVVIKPMNIVYIGTMLAIIIKTICT